MGRSACCAKNGLNRGAWTAIEDKILTDYIKVHGEGKWRNIPKQAGLKRCGKSCRLRWLNYLRPDIKRGNITQDEEDLIIRLHKLLGNRWSLIAGRLPGRTDNEIKNYWNSNLSKKAQGKQPKNFRIDKKKLTKKQSNIAETSQGNPIQVTPNHEKTVHHETDFATVSNNVAANSTSSEESLSLPSMEGNSSDFMMDFDRKEVSLSGILHTDFSKLVDFGTSDADHHHQLQQFSGQAFLLPEEMVENWSGSHCDMDSDFGSLASFLESAEEWII